MQPQLNGRRQDELDPHRSPTAEEMTLPVIGAVLVEPPRYGSWDPFTEAKLADALTADCTLLGSTAEPLPPPSGAGSDQALPAASTPALAAQPLAVASTAPTPAERKISKQTRRRLRLTQQALALRASGHSINLIAQEMGVPSSTIVRWFTEHRREVSVDQIDDMLDTIAVPLAAENLVHGLLAGDKDYTLETLKGRGRFRKHAEGEGKAPAALPELRISFELPTADQMQGRADVPAGFIVGQPQEPKRIAGKVLGLDAVQDAVLSSPLDDTPSDLPADTLAIGRPLGG